MPIPADEFPIHQLPLSFEHVGSSDRNFYDRCYFNAHDRTGQVFMATGLGVYPNLGVIDAYAIVRRGVLAEDAAFLQKPFPPEVLARRVRDVLDGADAVKSEPQAMAKS